MSLWEDDGGNVSEDLRFLLDYVSTKERPADWGLLEEGLVCCTHLVLLCNEQPHKGKMPAGRVSDKQRYSVRPDGSLRFYPVPDDMQLALASIFNRCNCMFEDCRDSYRISLFRTWAWLFCSFLKLHPFADGNGRLCLMHAQDMGDLKPLVACLISSICRAWELFLSDIKKRED